jgi:hypothetical protein
LSPELETLDQLLSGDLPLSVIRPLYSDVEGFKKGLLGLLSSGDIELMSADRTIIPKWRWVDLFGERSVVEDLQSFRAKITREGAKRVS